jgi:hypothetical protein
MYTFDGSSPVSDKYTSGDNSTGALRLYRGPFNVTAFRAHRLMAVAVNKGYATSKVLAHDFMVRDQVPSPLLYPLGSAAFYNKIVFRMSLSPLSLGRRPMTGGAATEIVASCILSVTFPFLCSRSADSSRDASSEFASCKFSNNTSSSGRQVLSLAPDCLDGTKACCCDPDGVCDEADDRWCCAVSSFNRSTRGTSSNKAAGSGLWADVYYTLDGSMPLAASKSTKLYQAPSFELNQIGTVMLTAVAVKEGMSNSPLVQRIFTIEGTPAGAKLTKVRSSRERERDRDRERAHARA